MEADRRLQRRHAGGSGAACAEVLKLRQALGAAQRRDTLDAELRTAEAKLAPLPAIVTADPQATMAADILAWISAGRVTSRRTTFTACASPG